MYGDLPARLFRCPSCDEEIEDGPYCRFCGNPVNPPTESSVDDDIETQISKFGGDFGIIQGDYRKIIKNIEKGIKPEKIFEAAIKGKKDLGFTMPIRGHASSSKETFENIHDFLSIKQKKLDTKFEKIASDEGLYKSYD